MRRRNWSVKNKKIVELENEKKISEEEIKSLKAQVNALTETNQNLQRLKKN